VGEANVVVGGAGVPADVDVARAEEVIEYFELELGWEVQQGGGFVWWRVRVSESQRCEC
jgi:hypothetical protein